MAIFNKSNPDSGHSSTTTIISNETHIKGEFKLGCILHVDGSVEGQVVSDSTVIIGKNGTIKGSISARRVIINGSFFGNIEAEFIEVLKGGSLVGDIVAQNLGIEIGAKFNGKSMLIDGSQQAALTNSNSEILLENKEFS